MRGTVAGGWSQRVTSYPIPIFPYATTGNTGGLSGMGVFLAGSTMPEKVCDYFLQLSVIAMT